MKNQEDNPSGDFRTDDDSVERPDLRSPHVREDVAMAGHCANVHLPTGRTCTLPARHPGSCHFVAPEDAAVT
ncbi:MAG: hypothetical protein JWO49_2286 [Arthrobacter sp.]|nr:hypothetical protein [Arthrobacter sp.]MCU1547845.1 hypothetical protein [Arthrobacter sp.]